MDTKSCACTEILCMHKILVHASGGSKTTIISVFLRLLPRSVYKNCVFYQRNDGWPSPSTAHAHKTCSGDRKNPNRDKSGKSAQVCTGYTNITGAPQAYAIWGTMLFTIETSAHHHQEPRVLIKSLPGGPRVIKNNVFCNLLCEEVSKTLIISVFCCDGCWRTCMKQCFLP